MLDMRVEGSTIHIGHYFAVSFQRTLRLPDDGRTYPLPPGLGEFPLRRVADFRDRVPAGWAERGGVFFPMYQREALWLRFSGEEWHPVAAKIAAGRVNALTGKPWHRRLDRAEQDYLVCPHQTWLDGINAGDGITRQFVAMPLGQGYTVEGQVTGEEVFGGIQIVAYDAKPGRFPDEDPRPKPEPGSPFSEAVFRPQAASGAAMGLAAGGKMRQALYPDPYGVETWDEANCGEVHIHIINSEAFKAITGEEPPPTPIDARSYTELGYPWFALYDEEKGRLPASGILAGVKSVGALDRERGREAAGDAPVEIPPGQVQRIDLADQKRRREE